MITLGGISLPSPKLNNSTSDGINTIIHRTMSGRFITHIDTTFIRKHTLTLKLTKSQIDSIVALDSDGLLVYIDHLSVSHNVYLTTFNFDPEYDKYDRSDVLIELEEV